MTITVTKILFPDYQAVVFSSKHFAVNCAIVKAILSGVIGLFFCCPLMIITPSWLSHIHILARVCFWLVNRLANQCAINANVSSLFSFSCNLIFPKCQIPSIVQLHDFFFPIDVKSILEYLIASCYSWIIKCNEEDNIFVFLNSYHDYRWPECVQSSLTSHVEATDNKMFIKYYFKVWVIPGK